MKCGVRRSEVDLGGWDCIGGGLIRGLLRGIDSGRSGSKVLMVVVVELVSWGNKMVG